MPEEMPIKRKSLDNEQHETWINRSKFDMVCYEIHELLIQKIIKIFIKDKPLHLSNKSKNSKWEITANPCEPKIKTIVMHIIKWRWKEDNWIDRINIQK